MKNKKKSKSKTNQKVQVRKNVRAAGKKFKTPTKNRLITPSNLAVERFFQKKGIYIARRKKELKFGRFFTFFKN